MLSGQFQKLLESEDIAIEALVRKVLPGHSLNSGFIHQLAKEPVLERGGKSRDKAEVSFDRELAKSLRLKEDFQATLFPSNQTEIHQESKISGREDESSSKGLLERVSGLISGPLLWPRWDEARNDLGDRSDDFRELQLLPAEFHRVRALNDAWLATSYIAAEALGEPLDVIVGADEISVQQGMEPANLQLPQVTSNTNRQELAAGQEF